MIKPFHTAHRWDLEWQDDVDVLSLRGGVQVKVFQSDPELGLADMLIKFPPGYVEPEHAHESSHSIVVLEGVQIVKGVHLHPGDYVWASGPEPHGPYGYPEGCVVFASFRGLSSRHRYQGSSTPRRCRCRRRARRPPGAATGAMAVSRRPGRPCGCGRPR
jgi:quercetin dioxygenase-like cupin family protein